MPGREMAGQLRLQPEVLVEGTIERRRSSSRSLIPGASSWFRHDMPSLDRAGYRTLARTPPRGSLWENQGPSGWEADAVTMGDQNKGKIFNKGNQ